MFKGQLLFGDCGLTSRPTWVWFQKSRYLSHICDINWPFCGFTEAKFWINLGEWASYLPQKLFFALLVEQLESVLFYFYMQSVEIMKITFWAEAMKMEHNKISFLVMILLRFCPSCISILHKIYGNIFKFYSLFSRLMSSITEPV